MTRFIFPLLLGLIGTAILLGLGTWQLQRLAWKEAILTDMEERLSAPAITIPKKVNRKRHRYQSVTVTGRLSGPELHVLTSTKTDGPGYRVIRALNAGKRRYLVDLGFVPEAAKDDLRPEVVTSLTGNIHWPDETDSFTPEPNEARNIWFARNVATMSAELDTDPFMIVARHATPDQGITPWPVTVKITNDHLEYAITWFSLAAVWTLMTLFWLWRINRAGRR